MEACLRDGAFDAACFHAQQIAEKSLKAFLAYRGVPFPYTHNLTIRVPRRLASAVCSGYNAAAWRGPQDN